jgi:hypothetical protein
MEFYVRIEDKLAPACLKESLHELVGKIGHFTEFSSACA